MGGADPAGGDTHVQMGMIVILGCVMGLAWLWQTINTMTQHLFRDTIKLPHPLIGAGIIEYRDPALTK